MLKDCSIFAERIRKLTHAVHRCGARQVECADPRAETGDNVGSRLKSLEKCTRRDTKYDPLPCRVRSENRKIEEKKHENVR